jgi:hypothetical protein
VSSVDWVSCPVSVEINPDRSEITVWPVETRSKVGQQWTAGIDELLDAQRFGDWSQCVPVWGYVGASRVAQGVADLNGSLRFRLSQKVFAELMSSGPRMRAAAVVDGGTARIMYVKFKHRQG